MSVLIDEIFGAGYVSEGHSVHASFSVSLLSGVTVGRFVGR